jgi:hypothetical protein
MGNVTDRIELRRLILQVERGVTARASLLTLLAAAELVLVDRRQELRAVRARIKRRGHRPPP